MTEIIVALDFNDQQTAYSLISRLQHLAPILKIGNEMFTLFGPNFVRDIVAAGYRVFLDLKFHDIPHTVARSCVAAADLGVWMLNIHASGGLKMMQTAMDSLQSNSMTRPLVTAVTVLTSLAAVDVAQIGCNYPLQEQALNLAMLAKDAGLDGVVCSAWDANTIKESCGVNFLTITPGIRLNSTIITDDQQRIATAQEAVALGSDYIVVGRPITQAHDPVAMLTEFYNILGITR
ncbi:MAG: orotidine 5'-phosphate decarboxylase [Legionellales bacterium RIFCSPHIGHO2_12_FULL_42_9]|nr:MAG: orotidine 5'-phosphate decarboxylase [Legionellales bacterium RIFCSPHIGHO2_12_FULL_42_9]